MHDMKNLLMLLCFGLLLFFGFQEVSAQTTGKIAGTVYDADNGEALPGANVILEGTQMGASTSLEGDFYVINVPPGNYTVSVQMLGYKTYMIEDLQVSVNRTAYIEARLQPALLEGEVIVVQAEKIATKKDQTSSMRAVSSEQMEQMPIENVSDVVALQAGVVNGHFRGGRRNEVSYMIDGLQVDESFGGEGRTVDLETDAISDLEVITGTFNAEYGRAMSGVVNAVTKDGGNEFTGAVSVDAGSYYTTNTDIFLGLDEIDVLRNKDYSFNLSGPVLPGKLTFFMNSRYQDNKNHLNGIRRFNVTDYSNFEPDNPAFWYSEASGDGDYVPMNDSKNLSYMGKLTYNVTNAIKSSLLYTRNDDEWNGYDHSFKYNPDGLGTSHRETDMFSLQLNHMLSKSAFYQVNLSYVDNFSGYYLFEDPLSDNYVHDGYLRSADNTGFQTGGQVKAHSQRYITDYNAKIDLTWQVNTRHSIKTGVLYTLHKLDNRERSVRNLYFNTDLENQAEFIDDKFTYLNYEPVVYGDTSVYSDVYTVEPFEFSGYIQDKMEFEEMVINLGVRLDYFNPNTVYPSDRRNPANDLFQDDPERQSEYLDADEKIQISPRLGLAYQLGSKAVLRFSYGHFFQMPPMYALFQNHSFRIAPTDYATTMGNAQLNAQKTIQYEIGLWQELFAGFGFEMALYYRDIYDLLSARVVSTYNQVEYGLYTNKDYGNTKGMEIKVDYTTGNWFGYLNYTLQYTRGNADNPTQNFNREGQNLDPVNRLIAMSWDQRHTFNASVGFHKNNFGITATGYYNSGTPYFWSPIQTSRLININLPPNNDYKPATVSLDLNAYYKMQLTQRIGLEFSLRAYNLLDRLNEYFVNSNTGRAYTAVVQESDLAGHKSNFNDYYDRIENPGAFSAPRYLKFGIGVIF
jgi:hypothetical protein